MTAQLLILVTIVLWDLRGSDERIPAGKRGESDVVLTLYEIFR